MCESQHSSQESEEGESWMSKKREKKMTSREKDDQSVGMRVQRKERVENMRSFKVR